MQKTWIRILAIICMLALLLPFLLTAKAAGEERYGYQLLTSDTQRTIYKDIAEGIKNLVPSITIHVPAVTTQEEANAVIADIQYVEQMVVKDFPEHFWFYGGGDIRIENGVVLFAPLAYSVNGQQVTADASVLKTAKDQMAAKIRAVMAKLPKNPSDYEIAHTIHDYLVQNVQYVAEGDHQTAYGALVAGKAVCAGYARAYQLLLREAGIDCWYVSGQSYAPNGELVAHAWNLVWLDGKCYYSDATWDDQNGELFHEYLNMSLEEISKTHFTTDPLPGNCGHDTYTFFRMSDGQGVCDYHGHRTADEVADCFVLKNLKGDQAEFYCTIHYHGDDFMNWLQSNMEAIAIALGFIGSYSCDLIELGLEHHVTLKGQVGDNVKPTEAPKPTQAPVTVPPTTVKPTVAPKPTQAPATVPPTTVKPTEAPKPTQAPETVPPTTAKPTEAPKPTQAPATVPPTTVNPTEAPKPTQAPATVPPTTVNPTEAPNPTQAPATVPPATEAPTTVPGTTGKPADTTATGPNASTAPVHTNPPASETTQKPTTDVTVPDVPGDDAGWVADPVVVGIVAILVVGAVAVIVIVLRNKKKD